VSIGSGTVSEDGSVIASDPGVGVLKAGWHCGGDPNANGTVADCPTCKGCQGNVCVEDPAQRGNQCENNVCKECRGGACSNKTDPAAPFNANGAALANTAPSATAVATLGGNYGLTWEETVTITISARCDGAVWRAVLTGVT